MTNKEGKCTHAHEQSCVHQCCNTCEPLVPCPTCQGLGLISAADLQEKFFKTERSKSRKVFKEKSTDEGPKTKPDVDRDVSVDCHEKKEQRSVRKSQKDTTEEGNRDTVDRTTEEVALKSLGDNCLNKEETRDNTAMLQGGGDGIVEGSSETDEGTHQTMWNDEHSAEMEEVRVTTAMVRSEHDVTETENQENILNNTQEIAKELVVEKEGTSWEQDDWRGKKEYRDNPYEVEEPKLEMDTQEVPREQEYWDDIPEESGECEEAGQEIPEEIGGEDEEVTWEEEWDNSRIEEKEKDWEREIPEELDVGGLEDDWEQKDRNVLREIVEEEELEVEDWIEKPKNWENTQNEAEEIIAYDQEANCEPIQCVNPLERVKELEIIIEETGDEITDEQKEELQWVVLGLNEEFTEAESEFFESGPSSSVSFHLKDLEDPLDYKVEMIGESIEDKYEMRKIVTVREAAVQVPHDMFSSKGEISEEVERSSPENKKEETDEFIPEIEIRSNEIITPYQWQTNSTERKALTTPKCNDKGKMEKGQTRSQRVGKDLTLKRIVSKEVISLKKETSCPNMSNKDAGLRKAKKVETEGSRTEKDSVKSEKKFSNTERGPSGHNAKKSNPAAKGNRWNY